MEEDMSIQVSVTSLQSARQDLPDLAGQFDHGVAHFAEVLGGGDQPLDADVVPLGIGLFLDGLLRQHLHILRYGLFSTMYARSGPMRSCCPDGYQIGRIL